MFGYITPMKPEMKVKDYELFRSYYCGVCMSIKKNYGNLPRLGLNYDMTFLAILLDSLEDTSLDLKSKRCIAHPNLKKQMIFNNRAIDYAASMNVSLVYFKLLDDKLDDNTVKSKLSLFALSPYRRKFSKDIEKVNNVIKENLLNLEKLEKSKSFTSIDEICHPFSVIVGSILKKYPYRFKNDSFTLRENLYDLGYSLGKWIYLIDALDDLKEDMEKDKFNPINYLFNKENLDYTSFKEIIKERIEFNILSCGSTLNENFQKLDTFKNKDIIQNVISLGMMDKLTKILNDCNCKECKKERNV
ncbi:MAG: DUF5685 family protein [Clostridium chrysemydis]|uniref:DUF5685 family protein n=1 Tax=Clostridium chrysemydis TaxID=2665504 RepID=UPI003F36975C